MGKTSAERQKAYRERLKAAERGTAVAPEFAIGARIGRPAPFVSVGAARSTQPPPAAPPAEPLPPVKPPRKRAYKPGPVEVDTRTSIEAMKQVLDSDKAAVTAALTTARLVDKLVALDDLDVSPRINAALSTLRGYLTSLGGTPTVRQSYEFKSRRAEQAAQPVEPEAAPDDIRNTGTDATVSQISARRPERRARRR